MKKIFLIILLLGNLSFSWQRDDKGYVKMSQDEMRYYFGDELGCPAFGISFLTELLMYDDVGEYDESLLYTSANSIEKLGKKIQNEFTSSEMRNLDVNEVINAYYIYKCKIPEESVMLEWGSPTFYGMMMNLKSMKANFIK